MSRKSYQARHDAREDWPKLANLLSAACHGRDDLSVQADLDVLIDAMTIDERQATAEEWVRWNNTVGAVRDVRLAVEAFDGSILFDTALHARNFMNDLYDRLVLSVRRETGTRWKP